MLPDTASTKPAGGAAADRLLRRTVDKKRSFYQLGDVAAAYDSQRFGGASGEHVNQRELGIVAALMPAGGVIADVACGTGRATVLLRQRGQLALALDTSLPMLRLTTQAAPGPAIQADAFRLPLRNGACDAALSMRLLFHFPDVSPLLVELRRVTRPGGMLVCDTYTWSPRALLPFGMARWGARVSAISPAAFERLARRAGWEVARSVHCFLFSPYLYRRLPARLVRVLDRLELVLPSGLL
ncbi:MAG: class I SAM-dependent methyltransferase, partial [Chloroflexota bacterium]